MLKLLISLKLIVYKKGSKWDKSYHSFWKKLLLSIGITSTSSSFNEINDKWYVCFDDAMISICSQTIGPKLPNNYEIFQIQNDNLQITIAEWYSIKYECVDIYKKIMLDIQKNTLYNVDIDNNNNNNNNNNNGLKRATESPIATRPLPQLIVKV